MWLVLARERRGQRHGCGRGRLNFTRTAALAKSLSHFFASGFEAQSRTGRAVRSPTGRVIAVGTNRAAKLQVPAVLARELRE